jgi:hypothetical protein
MRYGSGWRHWEDESTAGTRTRQCEGVENSISVANRTLSRQRFGRSHVDSGEARRVSRPPRQPHCHVVHSHCGLDDIIKDACMYRTCTHVLTLVCGSSTRVRVRPRVREEASSAACRIWRREQLVLQEAPEGSRSGLNMQTSTAEEFQTRSHAYKEQE